MDRRHFLWTTAAIATAGARACAAATDFRTRGVVLIPFDLTLVEWPERAAQAGLNTIGLHAGRRLDVLIKFVRSDAGQRFLAKCQRLGLNVEYELHAMEDLLSREYMQKDKSMFRMDKNGQRTQEFNCCPRIPAPWRSSPSPFWSSPAFCGRRRTAISIGPTTGASGATATSVGGSAPANRPCWSKTTFCGPCASTTIPRLRFHTLRTSRRSIRPSRCRPSRASSSNSPRSRGATIGRSPSRPTRR